MKQAFEKNLIHPAAETHFSINHYNRNTGGIALAKSRIGIDIDCLRLQSVSPQQLGGIVAQATSLPRIENDFSAFHCISPQTQNPASGNLCVFAKLAGSIYRS